MAQAGRQSPFRRQQSTSSPNPLRASTTSTSPTKPSLLSPARQPAATLDHLNLRPASPMLEASPVVPASPLRDSRSESPVRRLQNQLFSSPSSGPQSPLERSSIPASPSTQILASQPRTPEPPLRQPVFASRIEAGEKPRALKNNGVYNSIPAPLLRSLRESFEVLDPNATGNLNAAALPPVLEQIGLPVDSRTLSSFFPPNKSSQLNLASYLDMICDPLGQLSSPDELAAAFGAFDVDDSGQIDAQELKQALLRTVPEPAEANPGARLAEADVDAILQGFTSRRAFGSKSASAVKGDVFKWRDFVNSVSGHSETQAEVTAN